MIRKFIAAFALMFFVSTTAFAGETKIITFDGVTVEYPKDFSSGTIAMKDGVVFALGAAAGPVNWDKHDSFYKTFARQAARIAALRSLAEILSDAKHFNVKSDAVVVDGDVVNDIIKTELKHDSKAFKLLEKNARQIGNATFAAEGFCELFMAVRIEPRK